MPVKVVNSSMGTLSLDSIQRRMEHGDSLEFDSWAEAVQMVPEFGPFNRSNHLLIIDLTPPVDPVQAMPVDLSKLLETIKAHSS